MNKKTIEFASSKPFTIGMELELQLLHSKTLELSDSIIPIMNLYKNSKNFKPECIQNTIEIVSDVCAAIPELENHLKALLSDLINQCQKLEIKCCGTGTHLFSKKLAVLTPSPRYLSMEKTAGIICHTQITFANHIHVGLSSGDEAIYITNKLRAFIPLIIAVSANSPFWSGFDTGFAAYRHRILAIGRTYHMTPYFKNWQDFSDFLYAATRCGYIETFKDIHWDIRPSPAFGTVEIRVMDAQSSLKNTILLANFIHTLVKYMSVHPDSSSIPLLTEPQPPLWVEIEKRYQAAKEGINARYILDKKGKTTLLRDQWIMTYERLLKYFSTGYERNYLEELNNKIILEQLAYQQQIDYLTETGSLYSVTEKLIENLRLSVS
jgi:carboxylate-amine ligase